MHVLAVASVAVALAAPGPAAWQRKALTTAQRVWHPACGTLALTYRDPSAAIVVDDAPSRAGQPVPDDEVLGFTATGSCDLGLSSRVDWPRMRYPVFCSVVLHEAGRAAGLAGDDSTGIMSTLFAPGRDISRVYRHGRWHRRVIWSGVDRRCVRPMDRR